VAVVDDEAVSALAVPRSDAPTAPPARVAPSSAPLMSAFWPNFMWLLLVRIAPSNGSTTERHAASLPTRSA
jgi:hypothetical protein